MQGLDCGEVLDEHDAVGPAHDLPMAFWIDRMDLRERALKERPLLRADAARAQPAHEASKRHVRDAGHRSKYKGICEFHLEHSVRANRPPNSSFNCPP